jgi:zinc transport system substrate-binding protein
VRNMRQYATGAALLVILAAGAGCRGGSETSADPLAPMIALATLPPLGAMVRDIGGERVDVTVLVPPGHSPHSYEPTPGQLVQASTARLWFTMGSGVEFEISHAQALRENNPGMTIVECSERIELMGIDSGHDHHGHAHHDHGAHAQTTDPHVWTSPANARAMAYNVLSALIHRDPEHEDYFRENHTVITEALDRLEARLNELFVPRTDATFLTYHPSFGYFARDYGLHQRAIEEAGHQPGPAGVAATVKQARAEGVRVIVVSPQYDAASAQVVAEEIGGEVVRIDPLAEDYVATMSALAEAVARGQGTE